MPFHDKLMDFIVDMDKEESTLMVEEGGEKVNLWQSAAKAAKDVYYQSLFSGGEKLLPLIEKTLGSGTTAKADLLLRYMSGSGEEMPLSDDQGVIDDYLQAVHNSEHTKWQPTTNREINPTSGVPYADEGWEFTQVSPSWIMKESGKEQFYEETEGSYTRSPSLKHDIYNKLGKTSSVRRRELEGGKYEYMIVEPWDLIKGSGYADESAASNVEDVMHSFYTDASRYVPKELAILQKFAPDFVTKGGRVKELGTVRMEMNLSDYGKDWLVNKAKPFNITGSSIIRK